MGEAPPRKLLGRRAGCNPSSSHAGNRGEGCPSSKLHSIVYSEELMISVRVRSLMLTAVFNMDCHLDFYK